MHFKTIRDNRLSRLTSNEHVDIWNFLMQTRLKIVMEI